MLSTDIYARWHLNETTGTSVADSSGNARHGTIITGYGTYTWEAGKLNNCLTLVSDYVNLGNIANFERTDSFSFELWYKFTTTANPGCIFGKVDSAFNFRGYMFRIEAGKLAPMLINTFNINCIKKRTQGTFNDGNWHHIIVTYDGSSTAAGIIIYVDGSPVACDIVYDNLSGTMVVSGKDLLMSNRTGLGTPANGSYDEVLIYNKVLSSDEVTTRYNAGTGTEALNFTHSISEIVGGLDTEIRTKELHRTQIESLGLEDTKSRMKTVHRSITELLGLEDTKSWIYGRYRTITEALGLSDSPSTVCEYYNLGDDGSEITTDTQWLAQTFTVDRKHTVTSVKLKIYRNGNPGIITVSIRGTDPSTGHPTAGPDLTIGTTNGNTLPLSPETAEWRTITFIDIVPYSLSVSTKYAIVVREGGSGGICFWRCDKTTPTYSGGNAEFSHTGSTWASLTGTDFMFVVWGYKISRIKTYYRIRSEILGFLDVKQRKKHIHKTISEIAGFVDVKSRVKSIRRTAIELLGVVDTQAHSNKHLHRIIVETIGMIDRIAAKLSHIYHHDKPKQKIQVY